MKSLCPLRPPVEKYLYCAKVFNVCSTEHSEVGLNPCLIRPGAPRSVTFDYGMEGTALASIGFEALAKQIDKKPESIKRMLSAEGNPTLNDMATLLLSLKQQETK